MSRLFVVSFCALVLIGSLVAEGDAAVRITEFMSEGQGDTAGMNGSRRQREFFEITNLGAMAVDVSSWTYNDNNPNDPISWGAAIGSIAAGESILLTQVPTAETFRSYWGLPASVQVFPYLQLSNLGNGDTINIYNSTTQDGTTLVDSLLYTEDARGSGVSRNRPWGGDGATLNADWVISSVGDSFQSFLAPNATGFPPNFPNAIDYTDLANPGRYVNVPEPAAVVLLVAVMGALAGWRRRVI